VLIGALSVLIGPRFAKSPNMGLICPRADVAR